ncbi:MAG: hypothetical protein ACP5LH_03815 [Candidatus Micrarchaeia archaeon]
MQSICRFHEPASKKGLIEWYNKSILLLLWGKTFSSSQTILNQFDKMVKKANLNSVEKVLEKMTTE